MSLDLKTIRTRGRAGTTPIVLATRALSAAELEEHRTREVGVKAAPLKRLQSQHHRMAARLASGAKTGEVAAEFGITASRVSVLKADPTFAELIEYYRVRECNADEVERQGLRDLGALALTTLHEKLEDDPESIDPEFLLKVVEKVYDRTGHAPKRVEEKTLNVNFGDRLESARQRAREMLTTPIIDITPEPAE